MAVEPLTEVDPQCEEMRAAQYGFKQEQLFDCPLEIPPEKRMLLTAEGVEKDNPALKKLEPKTIDDVKRWIGVPDEVGAKRTGCCELPSEIRGVKSTAELTALSPTARLSLYEIAKQYVHGDSRLVAAFTPTLNLLVRHSWINVFLIRHDIHIYNGAVLTVGGSIKVLYARHIYIWQGGLLKFVGDAKIDCVSITGDFTGPTFIGQSIDRQSIDRLSIDLSPFADLLKEGG